jgi:hypothetical protein
MIKLDMPIESPRMLLDAAYENLGYHEGELLSTSHFPPVEPQEKDIWLEKGDWLTIAASVGAEKIFFVNNDPVIVFCEASDNDEQTLLNIFRQVWCMGRPQCLFIASPGALTSYTLNQPPAQTVDDWHKVKSLDVVSKTADVSERLHAYHREQVESGRLFTEKNFGGLEQRADKQLILDLKVVRQSLLKVKPKTNLRYIHALLGRSIFVRYLEDRDILTPEYCQKIAEDTSHPKWTPEWLAIVNEPEGSDLSPHSERRRYVRMLRNKDLTYALFNQLAEHFNGDMFPRNSEEEKSITQDHLDLLRGFLLGNTDPSQPKLLLWAYDFKIIPIELISSIYEEFYHQSSDKDKGTHYTPSVLVEYVLSQVLTPERLATKPKILDFACGSAIFLVQAFQRIVRFHESQLKRRLNAQELREILRTQITGIEINEEAIHIAAFSLYLALLHYQEPKSILAQIEQANGTKPLPFLIYNETQTEDAKHYPVLFHANSFSLMESEREFIKQRLDKEQRFKGRIEFERLYNSLETLPFQPNTFDVIVGNPPWGYLKKGESTSKLRTAQEHVLRWCNVFDWSIGDRELSQAFIARTLSFLKSDGECGLLVSTGVFLKRYKSSCKFRERWLSETVVRKVVSFTHVRDIFFSGAISPFCFVQFEQGSVDSTHRIHYWSAKKTEVVDKVQSVILNLPDLHLCGQIEFAENEFLWKVYWWGSHRDAALINLLKLEQSLLIIANNKGWGFGRGFEKDFANGDHNPSNWLKNYQLLPTENLERYGNVSGFEDVPSFVHRYGNPELYDGWRLLVKRGITQAEGTNGIIKARIESKSYCFLNSIHGVRIDKAEDWERKILIGILWSSLARYYLFMTTSSWGTWHHEIHLEDGLMSMPIRFPNNLDLQEHIENIVDELRNWHFIERDVFNPDGLSREEIKEKQNALEQSLDEAIFELYQLTEAERDLVLDMCETGLEFFYREGVSKAVTSVAVSSQVQGTIVDLPADRSKESGLEGYLYAFLQQWNQELESVSGEFRWQIIRPTHIPMLAIVFTTQQKGESLPDISLADNKTIWHDLLKRFDKSLRYPVSPRIYIDGMVRVVNDTEICIIKRDERRLWTRSMAREDAEATLLQAMITQKNRQR